MGRQVRPAVYFDIIQEWDGVMQHVTSVVFGKLTAIIYPDGQTHVVESDHYANDLYVDFDREKFAEQQRLDREKRMEMEEDILEQLEIAGVPGI
jgi:hypothetical protein